MAFTSKLYAFWNIKYQIISKQYFQKFDKLAKPIFRQITMEKTFFTSTVLLSNQSRSLQRKILVPKIQNFTNYFCSSIFKSISQIKQTAKPINSTTKIYFILPEHSK